MRLTAATLVAAAALTATAHAQSSSLSLGDQAPTLANTTWIQGEPVSHWQQGEVYVLDFWAPWCGPCIASMPHVNELHKKYKDDDVTVIGVSIWPRDNMTPTAQFVEEHVVSEDANEKMLYSVAEDINGATAKAFMDATGSRGIPTVMIIDQQGRLAWYGHPMDKDFDKSLEQVVAGNYNLEARAAEMRAKRELEAKAQPILAEANRAYGNADWDTVVAKLDELIALGYNADDMALSKIRILATQAGKPDEAWKAGRAFVSGAARDNAEALNALAWFIVDAEGLASRDIDLAQTAAVRANQLTNDKDPGILDTLAHVHFAKGDRAKAVEVQKRAVANASGQMKEELQKSLERFEKGEQTGG